MEKRTLEDVRRVNKESQKEHANRVVSNDVARLALWLRQADKKLLDATAAYSQVMNQLNRVQGMRKEMMHPVAVSEAAAAILDVQTAIGLALGGQASVHAHLTELGLEHDVAMACCGGK